MIPQRQGKKELSSDCRHRLTLQSRVQTPDGEGGHTEVWSETDTYWAAVYPMTAHQAQDYATINVLASHIIKVRGLLTIPESSRFLWGSRVFEILTVEDIQERNIVKVCACKERRD